MFLVRERRVVPGEGDRVVEGEGTVLSGIMVVEKGALRVFTRLTVRERSGRDGKYTRLVRWRESVVMVTHAEWLW